jgi:hypothetical protein
MTDARLAMIAAMLLFAAGCGGDDDGPEAGRRDSGAPPPPADYDTYAWLADPLAPARWAPGAMRLESSRARDDIEENVNDDWSHYPDEDGTDKTLLAAPGPGVVTRLWFTLRESGGPVLPELGERVELTIEVDGTPLEIGGATTASLTTWTEGTDPRWPAPWALGWDRASGAYMVLVPIHFARSFEAHANVPDDIVVYYQIDWRELPEEVDVRPTVPAPTDAELATLADVAARWRDTEPRGVDRREASGAMEATLTAAGPGVIRELVVENAENDDLLRIEVDGEVVADATVGGIMASPDLSQDYVAALSWRMGPARAIRYPIPFASTFVAEVRAAMPRAEPIHVSAGVDPSPPDAATLGRFHVECRHLVVESEDAVVFDLAGRAGQIAGHSLLMATAAFGWNMLEGDHEVRIDGEWSILGTGVEDYFGGAFYFVSGPFLALTQGLLGWNIGTRDRLSVGDPAAAMLRQHPIDPIGFTGSLDWRWENFGSGVSYDACTTYYLF